MKYLSLLAYLLVVFSLFQGCLQAQNDPSLIDLLSKAFKNGQELFDAFKSGDTDELVKKIKNIKEWAVPLVESFAAMLGKNITALIKDEEEELNFLKEQFHLLNNKLDSLEFNFGDIKNMIDLNNIKVMYFKSESSIRHLKEVLTYCIEAPEEIRPMLEDQFLLAYENQYQDAGGVIFRGLIINQLFSNSIIQNVRQFTKDDRAKTMQFIYSVSQVLLQAMQLEITYYTMNDDTFYLSKVKAKWEERMNALQDIIQETDEDILSKFEQNHKETLNELIIRNQHLSGSNFANFLVNKMTEKFFWKRWYVIVAGENKNVNDMMFVKNCGNSFTQFNFYGKTIVVNYGEKDDQDFDKATAKALLANVPGVIERTIGSRDHPKYIFDLMQADCDDNNKIIMVVDAQQAFTSVVPDTNLLAGETSITIGVDKLVVTKKYRILIVGK